MEESEAFTTSSHFEERLPDGRLIPADFDGDDVVMTRLFNEVFDIEGEILPPRYAQTLLGSDVSRPATDDFEERIQASVFDKLGLAVPTAGKVRPTSKHGLRWSRKQSTKSAHPLRQGLLALVAVVSIFVLNGLGTTSAFASVLRYITGQGGVQVTQSYPSKIASDPTTVAKPHHYLELAPQWAGSTIQGYTFLGMNLYDERWWSNGALVTMRYEKTDDTGVHHLTILEFMPRSQVALQVVKDGSVSNVPITNSINGVFVAGNWVHHNNVMEWNQNQRAELICQGIGDPKLVLWIAADGMTNLDIVQMQSLLSGVAKSLTPMSFTNIPSNGQGIQYIDSRTANNLGEPFGNDIIALIPDRTHADDPTVYIKVSADAPVNSDGSSTTVNGYK